MDWSVVCVVFSCSELKCCVLCNLYTFPLPFQRSGNRVQSVIPLTAAMIYNATHTGDNEFELDGVPLVQVRRDGEECVVRVQKRE